MNRKRTAYHAVNVAIFSVEVSHHPVFVVDVPFISKHHLLDVVHEPFAMVSPFTGLGAETNGSKEA